MKIATIPSLHGVSCCLNPQHGRWSWILVQPYGCECPGRIHGLPCSTLVDGCLPLKLSRWSQEDLEGRAPPIGFSVSGSPVLGSSSSYRLATQWIASYVLLYRTWHLQRGKTLEGDEGVGWNCLNHSAHLPAGPLRAEKDGTYEQHLLYEKSR
jgi:hypothetical protein